MSASPVSLRDEPVWTDGVPAWRLVHEDVRVLFLGRGAPARNQPEWASGLLPPTVGRAWLEQVHSALVLPAHAGACGRGDALVTRQSELAPIVATADCVPVLLASAQGVAAIHAGWRGVVAGVVGAAVDRLTKGRAGRDLVAWIGPAIGACCYEVGDEVAAAVAAASAPEVARRGASGRPHLDLARAVVLQLEAAGVRRLLHLDHCTRCRSEWLWSHRRDGAAAGRNLALVWRCQEGPWDGRGQG